MKIPSPRFVVFYNGTAPMDDQCVYRLSDMFEHRTDPPEMELTVRLININDGHNKELLDSCKSLKQYSLFVSKVRKYIKEDDILGLDSKTRKAMIKEAVTKAIDECIAENILKDFFEEYRREVIKVSVIEYSAERHLKAVLEEGLDKGITGAVACMRTLGHDDETILRVICEQYGLAEDKARTYL